MLIVTGFKSISQIKLLMEDVICHIIKLYKKNIGWVPDIAPIDCAMGKNLNFDEITEDEVRKIIANIED